MEGVTNVQPTDCLLYDIAENNRHLLTEAANQKRILIHNEVPLLAKAYADKYHVDIILRNLLLNAIKFTEDGGEVTIQCKELGEYVILEVADTGIGMTPEQIEKLFKINTHFTTSGTKNEKGAGLGLLLCKEFAEANQGKLSVISEPGNGTMFSITLPKSKYV